MRRALALTVVTVATAMVLLATPFGVWAQQNGIAGDDDGALVFKHLGVEQGLPSAVIHSVTQDALGFIWVGTEEGLARLDGLEVVTYPATDDSTTIRGSLVNSLAPGVAGVVWVGTNGGLSRYDPATDHFTTISGLPSTNVLAVTADGAGGAWVGTDAGGVRVDANGEVSATLQGAVRAILPRDGDVWFGTDDGLMHLEDGQPRTFRPDSLGAASVSISDIAASSDGTLLLGTRGQGLLSFDLGTERFTTIDIGDGLLSQNVTDVYEDATGAVWVATLGGGVRRVIPGAGPDAIRVYEAVPEDTGSLSGDQASVVFEDRQGILWVGTYDGLDRVDRARGAITRLRHDPQDTSSLSSSDVRAVLEDGSGTLWVGTDRALDRSSDGRTFTHFEVGGAIHALWETAGSVWAGTDSGLWRLEGEAPERIGLSDTPGASPTVTALLDDGNGGLWAGTETQGLLRYDLESRETRRVWFDGPGVEVTALALGARGALWIGTDGGLCRLDVPTSSASCFEADGGARSLASGQVHALLAQPNDALWIGTDAGLHYLDVGDLDAGLTRYQSASTDLPNDDVRAIVEDEDGFLWLSTGAGLSRFDPTTETFAQRAGVADMDRTLSEASVLAPDGRLYFGSTRGLLTFSDQLAAVNGNPPQVVITSIAISGQKTDPGDGAIEVAAPVAERITLAPGQAYLTIQYAALHFSTPSQNTFRYRLDGLYEDWRDVGNTREATFSSLPPGRYTFEVQAANSDGVGFADGARAAVASIEVEVLPPWWRTWWAITGFVLLFLLALVQADRWQRARLLRQERERAERREAELRAEAAEAGERETRAEAAVLKAENERKAAELDKAREVEAANAKLAQANTRLEASLLDLRQTQTQLVQSEKLASLGQLTAGIAHEIKNPLNFVNNFADLSVDLAQELREEMQDAGDRPTSGILEDVGDLIEDLQENARRIREHGQRADRIVRSMLLHSRGGSAERGRVEMNRFVEEYANLAFHGARANDSDFQVEIIRDFDDDTGEVEVVPQEFGRVLINLLTNAFHAVNERSEAEGTDYRPKVTVSTVRTGSNVEIVIRDNGTGIPEAVKAKIFEPFFTTKPTGQGTGLGLSLAHDIVTQVHGGQMSVESVEGEGTAFHIVIPDRQPEAV